MPDKWSTWAGLDLHVNIDRSDLRRSVETVLRNAVQAGRLPAGTRLPSTRVLAADLGVARGTVTQAYEQLVAEGYLTARQGSGTRVAALVSAAVPVRPAAGAAGTGAAGPAGGGLTAGAAGPRPAARWDFFPGTPDLSAFPRSAWLVAARRVLAATPAAALGYGDARGTPALRQALAGYLGRARGVLTSPDQIVVCSGYAHALGLLAAVLRARGAARLAFEDPSLARHRDVAARAGLAIEGVPVDQHGIRVDQIRGPAVVVTPAHQYPTGVTLNPARRASLSDWARAGDGLIIEDDYDGEFRYDRQPVGAMQGLAPEHVIYAGTASKTLAPGLRLAWLALPPALTAEVSVQLGCAGSSADVLGQLVLADLIGSGGYDRHIRQARSRYRARRDRLAAELARQAPAVALRGIAAGLHALAGLPAGGPGEAEVTARAWARGIAVEPLGEYWIRGGDHPPGLVIGYATPAGHAFEPGLAELAGLLGELTRPR